MSQQLMFYTLAAQAHPGYDGAPRKAILHYQQQPSQTRHQYTYPSQPVQTPAYPVFTNDDGISHPEYPFPTGAAFAHAAPQPAQFANAGPPGYAYDPSQSRQAEAAEYGTGLGITGLDSANESRIQWGESIDPRQPIVPIPGVDPRGQDWRARSQWSSPMTGHFDPRIWQLPEHSR
jgi:hypothetical protein